ncbi:CdvA-like protein [Candidatus Hecatella orcuttiae]|uniref:CdvA-like protein n=1 Tax=Candidatus Hecatella orcuttiae TaxID=1935119 RepID=UPI002867CE56|nr:CdvA-like protein [Candidatus Hecatella orcuttiae]
MSLQYEALQRFIGKPARDTYRRYIGYVVGVTLDPDGQLHSVGVDRGGSFEEFSRAQIIVEGDTLILVPSWKIEAENFKKDNDLTQRRFRALDELLKSQEIPSHVYEELCQQYKDSLTKLEEAHKNLIESLNRKISDLEHHVKNLERFLGHLKVQHKTGELGDETYKLASDYLISVINSTINEKRDIEATLNSLTVPQNQEYPKLEVKEERSPAEPLVVRLQTDEE